MPDEVDSGAVVARELAGHGLLAFDGTRFALTARGLPLADAVAKRFLAALTR